jgi:hypothetical protein
MKPSQNSLFKADAYVRAVAGVEFWDWFIKSQGFPDMKMGLLAH